MKNEMPGSALRVREKDSKQVTTSGIRQGVDKIRYLVRRAGWLFFGIVGVVVLAFIAMIVLSKQERVQDNLVVFVFVGFLAQLIDGALGMGYGVTSTTFLLSSGLSPAAASASVHAASVFTTLTSGLSHLRLGNVDKTIFRGLVIPGILGGVVGAYLLSKLPGDQIKPLVAFYLMLMGVRILWKSLRHPPKVQMAIHHLFPLGVLGGFFSSMGGGGWGPIVTTTLVARGNHPRYIIGSVNMAEFFVTFFQAITFILTVKFAEYSTVILGLVIGGVVAAPMAAWVTKSLSPRKLMMVVGILIIGLSLRTIALTL
jgi:uncharacterized membrane protein YfcA